MITPHVDAIRHEFGNGFNQWHTKKFGEPAQVEWRVMGGTSDSLRFVLSEFSRKPEGIGLDIFFGGGQEPFLEFARRNLSVAHKPPPEILGAIPQQLNGMDVYDAQHSWYGASRRQKCLEGLRPKIAATGIWGLQSGWCGSA